MNVLTVSAQSPQSALTITDGSNVNANDVSASLIAKCCFHVEEVLVS